jgi:hypothetical protein
MMPTVATTEPPGSSSGRTAAARAPASRSWSATPVASVAHEHGLTRGDRFGERRDVRERQFGQAGLHRRVDAWAVVQPHDAVVVVDVAEGGDIGLEHRGEVLADDRGDIVGGDRSGELLCQVCCVADHRVRAAALLVVAGAAQSDDTCGSDDDRHDPQQEPADVVVDGPGVLDVHDEHLPVDRSLSEHAADRCRIARRQHRVVVGDAEAHVRRHRRSDTV